LAAYLNKVGGLSYGKIAALLRAWMGFSVSRSALCRAVVRLAAKGRPTYEGVVDRVRGSPVVYPDETGWRIGGHPAWLWVATNGRDTAYAIHRGRGYAEAASLLGKDYAGVLVPDGWAPYRKFEQATLQTCLAHLLRRCHEMLETAKRGAVRFPRAVQGILKKALELRDRRDAGTISEHGLRVARGRLAAEMARLLAGRLTQRENRRLAGHLRRYEKALFVFLGDPQVEATNWPAEQAIRPAVVNRKSSGGNRTIPGAEAQAVLTSLLRTCHQKGIDVFDVFTSILRSPKPIAARAVLTT
jgi:transposase